MFRSGLGRPRPPRRLRPLWPWARRRALGLALTAATLGLGVLATAAGTAGCYATGDGTAPPEDRFYYPTGLLVSPGGHVLYVANSDFDLQFNGGTLQSYDLTQIRRHAALLVDDPGAPELAPILGVSDPARRCRDRDARSSPELPWQVQTLGRNCAPPVDSRLYRRDSVTIGAFATDLQMSVAGSADACRELRASCGAPRGTSTGARTLPATRRLFVPIRGNASLTWVDIVADEPDAPAVAARPDGAPQITDTVDTYTPFRIDCGVRGGAEGTDCDAAHVVGRVSDPGNSRGLTLPGEPFGQAQTRDGTALLLTHQSETRTSLFRTGLNVAGDVEGPPSLQFLVEQVVIGGNGIAAIPQDPLAFPPCSGPGGTGPCAPETLHPAFLQTSRTTPEVTLLRYYADEGGGQSSSLLRPFLVREAAFPVNANPGGQDSRSILVDPTPRIACELAIPPAGGARTEADVDEDRVRCARRPARVFIANRTPASLLMGQVGDASLRPDGSYDPTRLTLFKSIPLTAGPSRLYLAPVIDASGFYALRLFAVCFDSNSIFVLDPDTGALENIIRVGPGPYAMSFDPFSLYDILDKRQRRELADPAVGTSVRPYRFAYVASFTQSYVQVIDLDNTHVTPSGDRTFETVVFTLGRPQLPKGGTR